MTKENPKAVVIFFGGAMDSLHENMKEVYRSYSYGYHEKKYYPWTGNRSFSGALLRSPCDAVYMGTAQEILAKYEHHMICLVGHSYGGDTAMRVAYFLSRMTQVGLLVTLDPVSMEAHFPFQRFYHSLQDEKTKWINVYVKPELISVLGGRWGYQAFAYKNIFIGNAGHANADDMFRRVSKDVRNFDVIKLPEVIIRANALPKKF